MSLSNLIRLPLEHLKKLSDRDVIKRFDGDTLEYYETFGYKILCGAVVGKWYYQLMWSYGHMMIVSTDQGPEGETPKDVEVDTFLWTDKESYADYFHSFVEDKHPNAFRSNHCKYVYYE